MKLRHQACRLHCVQDVKVDAVIILAMTSKLSAAEAINQRRCIPELPDAARAAHALLDAGCSLSLYIY